MNTHDLSLAEFRAVAAVAATGHFGRAATTLRVSQPTLSAQVQKVERVFGTRLFERSARRFLITPDGERLLPLVRETLLAAERLQIAAAGSTSLPHAPLRLGIIPTLGPYFMPHLLLPLRRECPELQLAITEQPTSDLTTALLDGTLDAALLSLPIRTDSLECTHLFDEPFRLIAPRGSTILKADRLSPGRLCACDMVLLEEGHCLREQAIAVCSKRGGTSPRMVTTSLETLKYLVAADSGYSLLPSLACEVPTGLKELVKIRSFDERPPSRQIGLCLRRTLARRERVELLAEFIRRHLPVGVDGA